MCALTISENGQKNLQKWLIWGPSAVLRFSPEEYGEDMGIGPPRQQTDVGGTN